MKLVTLATVRTLLELGDQQTQNDPLLELYIDAASEAAETYCGRTFEVASVTEYFDIDRWGTNYVLRLNRYPVQSVTSVKLAFDSDFDSVDAVASDLYILHKNGDTGRLELRWNVRPWPNCIQVAYTGGLGATPAAIEASNPGLSMAVATEVIRRFKNRDKVGLAGIGMQGSSTTLRAEDLSREVKRALTSYRRLRL